MTLSTTYMPFTDKIAAPTKRAYRSKCDRKSPCNICTERGVPHKCLYQERKPLQHGNGYRKAEDIDTDDVSLIVDESGLSALSASIGYVDTSHRDQRSATQSTAFTELRSSNRRAPKVALSAEQLNRLNLILKELPPPTTLLKLVDVFFSEANWYFTVLDRYYFDRNHQDFLEWIHSDVQTLPSNETILFSALLYQVLAMALQFLPPSVRSETDVMALESSSFDIASKTFSDTGEDILALLGRRAPETTSIQADIMRCAWLKNSGNGAEAWYSLGNAVRQAQDAGLHLEPPEPAGQSTAPDYLSQAWYNEHKRRIWACLLSWEAHMAIQLGRPRMINIADCTVRAPVDCDIPRCPSRTLVRASGKMEPPSNYTSQILKYELGLRIHRALSLGLMNQSSADLNTVIKIHEDVERLVMRLPRALNFHDPDKSWDLLYPDIVKQRIQIQIIAESFLMTLHRPHIANHPRSMSAAVQAAKNVLDLSQEIFNATEPHQQKVYTLCFYTIDAGIFLAAVLAKSPAHTSQGSREALLSTLDLAVERLGVLKKGHSAAAAGESVLRSCISQIQRLSQPSVDIQDPVVKELPSDSRAASIAVPGTEIGTFPDDYNELFDKIMNDSAFTSTWLDENLAYFDSMGFDTTESGMAWNVPVMMG